MKNVLIFCGANKGFDPIFEAAAHDLATQLAELGINIITGGGSVGLMGTVADAALAAGGTITGIIPDFLNKLEVGHNGLTEMIVVETMHERKDLMHQKCDAIIALAGGYGTLDELFESLTWAQLDQHRKPIAVLNTKGFYNHLFAFLNQMVVEGLLKKQNRDLILTDEEPAILIQKMMDYEPSVESKWIK